MIREIYLEAKKLLEEGCSVIPIKFEKKSPAVKWTPFHDRVPTSSEVAKWFARTNHQLGLVTGVVSGGRFILDFDGINFQDAFLDFIEAFPEFEKGAIVRTGSGKFHVHGKCPDMPSDITRKVKKILGEDKKVLAAIELRANKHMALVPPSKHKSGNFYEYLNSGRSPTEVTLDRFTEIVKWMTPKDVLRGMKKAPKQRPLQRKWIDE